MRNKSTKLNIKSQVNGMAADIGHHFRNVHLQNLVDENQELRRRISKLTEIEGYVELLVEKLEKAEVKEKAIASENNILRQQVREMEIKFANSENMHGDQMRYVFSQHDQLVEEKNMAILQIKNVVEKESSRAAQLDSEARFQKANEQKMVAEYEEALINYRNRVNELEQDLNVIYKSLEEEKFHHNSTKNAWATESSQLKQALQEKDILVSRLKDEINSLASANQKLEMETNVLVDFNQKLEDKLAQTEQEMAESIMRLRDNIEGLEGRLVHKEGECQHLQLNNASLLKEVDELKIVQAGLKADNETYVTDNQRLIFLLEESDKENLHLREKSRELEDYSSVQIEHLKLENLRLREENNVLSKNNAERENLLGIKLMDLKEATSGRDSLKVYFDQAQGELVTLRAELAEVQDGLISEKQFSTEVEMERKRLAESVTLLSQESRNSEEMLKKIQKENLELSSENHNLARVLGNPREQNRGYVEQMDKVVKNFHNEREEQNHRHWAEKEKLKEMYEYDFKQKEMELMRQIAALQEEQARSTKLQLLVEREKNKSSSKTQFRTPVKH